ncbi:hypothetical protein [Myxococcus sp. NMCA1]|uniref:hypothetical protein n=1 Tax=Myxococcus sp. NMCA1 TaxID=2996785 RepID=UPI002286C910|nr:hypothetical protein [Myxococcus sp. NMCA1]WAM28515.1 hypothetical protein OZ403_10540 [Myxococcus sp. NMCA1]
MHPSNTQIGHLIHAANQALPPDLQGAGTRNGAALDVSRYQSGVLVANVGEVAGAPTATSVRYTVQTSPNGTDGWVPLKDMDDADVVLTVTAAGTCAEKDFNLQYADVDHSFLRVVEVIAFTEGTTPSVMAGATLVFGGGQRLPL